MLVDLAFPFAETHCLDKRVDSEWELSFCSLGSMEFESIEPVSGPMIVEIIQREERWAD